MGDAINSNGKEGLSQSISARNSETVATEVLLEVRELKSRFNIWSAIGIGFSITATPLAVGVYLVLILGAGGSPFFFYSFLVAAFGQLLVCLCLAEIASAFPHASGMFLLEERKVFCSYVNIFQAKSSGQLLWPQIGSMLAFSATGTEAQLRWAGSSPTLALSFSLLRYGSRR